MFLRILLFRPFPTANLTFDVSIQAKTDLNYARFFSILRSASTPYLTACLMFKHVEAMRKAAFRICNRAYGGKNREEEAIHDSYPLQRLTALLCFESDDETRSSCRHYNITVVNDGNGREFISWKGSSFREPKDPDKGTVIYLRPQKMIRTIERKLKGATRLAVCRGEYSGNVSHLPGVVGRDRQDTKTTSTNESIDNAIFQQTLKENEAKRKQLLDRQRHAEVEAQHEKEIEQRKAAQLEREMIEAKIQLKKRQQLEEVERREKERIEQERIEQEREVRRKLAQALEKKKAEEEESRRKEYLRQEERRMQELEKRKRQEEEQRLINEAEKIRQQQQYEAELRRLEILEQKEQQRLEAEARQLREKLCKRVTDAKKTLIWRRMEYKTLRVTSSDQTKNTVSALKSKRLLRNESLFTISISPQSIATAVNRANQVNLMKSLEYILLHRQVDGRLNELFASMVRSAIEEARHFPALKSSINRKTCLFKVCIVFPTPRSRFEQCQCDLVRAWITSHVDIGRVTSCCSGLLDVRVVFVENSAMYDTSSDTTLFIIPPSWSDLANDRMAELSALAEGVNDNVPRVVLSLSECFDSISRQAMTEKLSTIFSGGFKGVEVVGNDDLSVSTLEHILLCSFDRLATALANKNPRCVERISIGRIYYNCLSEEMWKDSSRDGTDDVLGQVMKSIDAVVDNVDNISVDLLRDEAIWPSCEFLSNKQEASFVIDYFGESACLPSNWSAVSLRRHLEPELKRYHGFFEGPYTSTVERLVSDAPDDVKWQCTSLLENNFTKASLQTAWLWRVEADESSPSCQFVYLPVGRINSIFSAACSTTGSPEVSQTRNESSYTYTWCPQELDAETTIVEYSEKSDDDVLARRSNPNEQIPVMGKRNSIRPDTSFCIPSQRCLALLPVDVVRTTGDKKRRKKRRASSQGPFSDALVESVCFTRMLEKLVCDDELEKLLHEHGGP